MNTAAVLTVMVKANTAMARADLGKFDKDLRGVDSSAGKSTKNIAKNAKVAGFALAAGLGVAAKAGFSELAEGQKVSAQTAAALKSTKGAANVSQKAIEDLAGAISRKTGIDDEQIQASQNLLLTFTNIRNGLGKNNKIFDRATKTVQDMSVALGQSGKTSAIQLGKALNDPIKGVSALQRVGVSFTESQKEQIKRLVESGKTMKAQKLILGELNKEFGGSAEAAGDTFPGQLNKLKNSFEDVAGGLVASLLPALQKLAGMFAKVGTFLQENPKAAKVAGAALAGLAVVLLSVSAATKVWAAATKIAAAAQWLLNVALSANPIGLVVVALAALAAGLIVAYKKSETFRRIVDAAFAAVKNATQDLVDFIKPAIQAAFEFIKGVVNRVLPAIVQIFRGFMTAIQGVVQLISSLLKGDFRKAWDAVKQIFRGALQVAAGLIRAFTAPFREAASRVGGAISGAFSDAWDKVKSGVSSVKGWLSDRWGEIKNRVSDFAGGVKNAIEGAFKGAVNSVIRFVNKIIDVINAIPGVPDIGKIKELAQGGTFQAEGFARGGAFARTKGRVNKPITLMGEEAPRFPEYVIPTNPAHRKRAQMLAAEASRRVGLYSSGGRHGDGTGGPLSFLDPRNVIGSLPSAKSLGWMAGLGKWTVGKVAAWIKKQLGSLMGRHAPGWGVIDRLASELGLGITSTLRQGDDGFHGIPLGLSGRARATDYSGSAGAMLQFAKLAATRWGANLRELIHSPLGFGIDEGKRVSAMFFGPDVYQDHFDHVHTAFARGGIHQAAVAAHAAGFRGENLVRAIAIAGAETGGSYDPRATNFKYPDHSIGPWQINQLAHKGRFGSDKQLMNINRNARAAYKLFRESGFRPWSTWPGKAAAYMRRARRAVAALKKKGVKPKGKVWQSGLTNGQAIFENPPPPGWESGGDLTPPTVGGGAGGGGSSSATTDTAAADLAAQIRRMNDFNDWLVNTQGPTLIGAVVSAVNGGIGGPVGLGFQGIRSAPGSVAGL